MPPRAIQYRAPKVIREKLLKKQSQRDFLFTALFSSACILAVALAALGAAWRVYHGKTPDSGQIRGFFMMAALVVALGAAVFSHKKAKKIKPWFYRGVHWLVWMVFSVAFFMALLPEFAGIAAAGVLLAWRVKWPSTASHNVLALASAAGIGVFFGSSLPVSGAIIIIVAATLFDFFATYVSGAISAIAKDFAGQNLLLGFVIPKRLREFSAPFPAIKKLKQSQQLGLLQAAAPAVLVAAMAGANPGKAAVVAVFSLAGVAANAYLVSHHEGPEALPASPAITLAALCGYAATAWW